MARFPTEKGASIYSESNFRRIYRWTRRYGHVLATGELQTPTSLPFRFVSFRPMEFFLPLFIIIKTIDMNCLVMMLTIFSFLQIQAIKHELLAAGKPLVANGAPASILCSFPNPNQTNLGYVFMIEFFVDSFLAIIIWAVIDPSNPFVSPAGAPFVIGLAYAAMVWGFADVTISTNMARDLGTRLVAAIFFGKEAFTYMNYSPIAILVSIPATLFGTGYYEFVLKDSLASISKGHAQHEEGDEGLIKHLSRTGGWTEGELEKIRTRGNDKSE